MNSGAAPPLSRKTVIPLPPKRERGGPPERPAPMRPARRHLNFRLGEREVDHPLRPVVHVQKDFVHLPYLFYGVLTHRRRPLAGRAYARLRAGSFHPFGTALARERHGDGMLRSEERRVG